MLPGLLPMLLVKVTMADTKSTFEQAVAAYKEKCDRNSLTFHQPSEEHSNMIHDVMYLRVSPASYVARYDIRRQRVLA
ncbi:hypothetical protein DXZ20_29260 [Leptolyngbyaceae cyanobacterium CCMR0081]|uniref:Uncharacterized protein n=2 Tax=Adonisia TaxID=2950183 RepID=A0A6M0RTV1_9CYAN|nr:hypothetical protein [Adonisia turfae CCMR0081]